MSLGGLFLTAAVGALVGLLSGLLGIGGGILVVPFLYLLLAEPGWSGVAAAPGSLAAVAHATSLAVILPTALAGIRAHRRAGGLELLPLAPLGAGAVILSVAGALTATRLPTTALQGVFALLLLAVGLRLLGVFRWGSGVAERTREAAARWSAPRLVAAGGAVGFLSALMGIGGGVVAIPLLLLGARIPVERVAGASLVVVLCAAVGGVLTYGLLDVGRSEAPAGSWGYVFLPAAGAMLPGAVLCAPLGARLNRWMAAETLRRTFGVLLLVMAGRILWWALTGPGAP